MPEYILMYNQFMCYNTYIYTHNSAHNFKMLNHHQPLPLIIGGLTMNNTLQFDRWLDKCLSISENQKRL